MRPQNAVTQNKYCARYLVRLFLSTELGKIIIFKKLQIEAENGTRTSLLMPSMQVDRR